MTATSPVPSPAAAAQAVVHEAMAAYRPATPHEASAALRYLGSQPLSLTGPVSGRVYYFAAAAAAEVVDQRDVEALLRTGLFARHAGSAA